MRDVMMVGLATGVLGFAAGMFAEQSRAGPDPYCPHGPVADLERERAGLWRDEAARWKAEADALRRAGMDPAGGERVPPQNLPERE